MRKAGPHALDDRLLGCKAHGQKSHRARAALELGAFLRQQQVPYEALAVFLVDALDAIDLEDIDADAENHGVSKTSSERGASTLSYRAPPWPIHRRRNAR